VHTADIVGQRLHVVTLDNRCDPRVATLNVRIAP